MKWYKESMFDKTRFHVMREIKCPKCDSGVVIPTNDKKMKCHYCREVF